MKTILFLLLTVAFYTSGCKKDGGSTSAKVTSEWTFDGKTYKVTGAIYDDGVSGGYLFASDDAGAVGGGNYLNIAFGAITKPPSSTTLTVIDLLAPSNPSKCMVDVGNLYGDAHYSTGKAGDKVNLTVSSTGKLTASFSNITVSKVGSSSTKTVSGTIREE